MRSFGPPLAVLALFTAFSFVSPAHARPCTTVSYLAMTRDAPPLLAAARLERPFEPGLYLDSSEHALRVHYQNEALATVAGEVLAILDDAWLRQVDGQGYSPPLPDDGLGGSDALDVYLVNLGPGIDALTLADDDESDDGRHAASVHLQVNPSAFELEGRLHHEFQHALQFAIDASESLMWFESTAVFQEWLKDPEGSSWADELPAFQTYPEAPVFTNGIDWARQAGEDVFYEYGAVLFVLYLEQRFGDLDGSLVRALWEGSIQGDDVDENEPDWMDALVTETGVGVGDVILDFATWRMLVAGSAVEGDGPPGASSFSGEANVRARALLPEILDGSPLNGTDDFGAPHQNGCPVFAVSAPENGPLTLEVDLRSVVEGDPGLGLAWAIGSGGDVERTSARVDGFPFVRTLEIPAGARLRLAVCDTTEADADELPVPHPIELRLWNTAVERYVEPDAGSADGGAADGGELVDGGDEPPVLPCSCQSTELPEGGPFGKARRILWPAMFLIGMVSLLVRGRRAMKRRKSYLGHSQSTVASSNQAPPND